MAHIWLASYPRSGNTFLRTILWHCFGLRSASIYPDDVGAESSVAENIGHVELSKGERFEAGELELVKTHGPPQDQNPAIYVVRDGRAATTSMWHFYNQRNSIVDIINGHHKFSTWSNHIEVWSPWARSNTLFLRYEDLVTRLDDVLTVLSQFLSKEIVSSSLPTREQMAATSRKLIRTGSAWQEDLHSDDLDEFYKINGTMMKNLQYID